jgi:hypothetical protein
MIEIEFDLYSSPDLEDMLVWCRRNLPATTWSVTFCKSTSTFKFTNHQQALYFSSTWQPPHKKKSA